MEDASVVALTLLLIAQLRCRDRSTALTADLPSQRQERQRDRRSPVEILHNVFRQKLSLYRRTAVSNAVADQWIDACLRLVLLCVWQTFLCSNRGGGGTGKNRAACWSRSRKDWTIR